MTQRPTQATPVDAGNSTSTPLGVGGVFTGKAVEMVHWASVSVFVFSDVGSAVDGLSLQQSVDGINWDLKTEFAISALGAGTFGVDLESQFFRVVYTNGSVAQTEFRLQSVFHETRQVTPRAASRALPVRLSDGTAFIGDRVPAAAPLLNDEHGDAMNIDAAFGGTPLGVHNGIDSTLWTGSNITGSKVVFNHTARPDVGSASVRIDNPDLDDVWQFLNPAGDVSAGAYVAITLRVNIDKDWNGDDEVEVYAWDTGTGTIVGNAVPLTTYMNQDNFDVWMSVTVPFADMGITSSAFDAIRMTQSGKSGKAAKWYLDEMQLEETGTPLVWTASAPASTRLYIHKLRFTIADEIPGTVANGTMTGIDFTGFLGVPPLITGAVIRLVKDGVTILAFTIRSLGDFQRSGADLKGHPVSNGTNTLVVFEVEFDYPIIIEGAAADNHLSITISEDLSGLLLFNVAGYGGSLAL